MAILYRKLAMLENDLNQRIENAKISGYAYDYLETDFKHKLSTLMDKVRLI